MDSRLIRVCVAISLFVPFAPLASGQQVWHVRAAAPPGGDGTTWATAFDSLQDALDVAGSPDQVWVARGRYVPELRRDPADPQSVTFEIPPGAELYGGFAGNETSLPQRAGAFDSTILSGELGVLGDPTDNAYHVVMSQPPPNGIVFKSVLDGFLVRDGWAKGGGWPDNGGGGVYCNNTWLDLSNCVVTENSGFQGGGLYQTLGRVRIKWCLFERNKGSKGGAMFTRYGAVFLTNSILRGNLATNDGGALYEHSNSGIVEVVGCEIYDNVADRGGAAYFKAPGPNSFPTSSIWVNDTIAFNQATEGGGAFFEEPGGATPVYTTVVGSILWSNAAPVGPEFLGNPAVVKRCTITGGYPGSNSGLDPVFVDGPGRDLRILRQSPCVDAANNNYTPPDFTDVDDDGDRDEPIPLDLGRLHRYADHPLVPDTGVGVAPILDQGAHEVPAPTPAAAPVRASGQVSTQTPM